MINKYMYRIDINYYTRIYCIKCKCDFLVSNYNNHLNSKKHKSKNTMNYNIQKIKYRLEF
jgi:hypothetical protein